MKNQAQKAINLLKSLYQINLVQVKAGNFKPLSGRNAKLTRLYLLSLPETQKASLFDRLEQEHLKTLVGILEAMSDDGLAVFMRELDTKLKNQNKPGITAQLFGEVA